MSLARPDRSLIIERSVQGSVTLLGVNALVLTLAVAGTMVLARLLTPADFGLFAMASIVLVVAGTVRDFGFVSAIVHADTLDADRLDRLFRRNVAYSALLAAALMITAPLLHAWFDRPELVPAVLSLAIASGVRSVANVHVGLLTRRMKHGTLARTRVISEICGVLTAILLAMRGAGVAALVAQQIVSMLIQTALLSQATPWRPRWRGVRQMPDNLTDRALNTYARENVLARLVAESSLVADRIIVGGAAGAGALGLYQGAFRWSNLTMMQTLQPFKQVAIAGFSELRENVNDYQRYAANIFIATQSVLFPLLMFLCVEAQLVVNILLGDQWQDAVPLLRLFAIAMLLESIDRMLGWVYLGEGRTRTRLYWQLVLAPLLVVSLWFGMRFGIVGVAVAYLLFRAAMLPLTLRVCLRASVLSTTTILGASWLPMLASLFASLVVYGVQNVELGSTPLSILLHVTCFFLAYAAVWLLLPHGRRHILSGYRWIRTNHASKMVVV